MSNIYLDVETIPAHRPDVLAWLAAKAVAKEASPADAMKALRDTSLRPTLGELAVVSFALDDNEPITIVRAMRDPEGERRLVDFFAGQMWDLFRSVGFRRDLRHIVAWNASFDRTVIRTRAMVHRIALPPEVHALGQKPWDSAWHDPMESLKMDQRGGVSLDEACIAFGVGLPKGDIDGSRVWDAIQAGRIDEVATYCADDVRRVRACYHAIQSVRAQGPG